MGTKKNTRNGFLITLLLLLMGTSWCAIGLGEEKSTQRRMAQRIITLSPHLTEMVFDLDLGASLVGVSQFSNVPPLAKSLPRVGDAFQLNVEAIVSLNPTLILAWEGGVPRAIRTLRSMGIPVVLIGSEGLSTIGDSYRRLGAVLNKVDAAEVIASRFERQLEELSEQNPWSGQRVFMQIQDVRLFTVNSDHFMGQALAICGVDNIFADAPLSVAPVSLEAVIGAQPNVIVTVSQANQKDPWIEMWRTHLPAARLVEFPASDISQPVARILGGVSALCNALNHGVIERASYNWRDSFPQARVRR